MTKREIAELNRNAAELSRLMGIVVANQEKRRTLLEPLGQKVADETLELDPLLQKVADETWRQRKTKLREVGRSVVEEDRVAIARRKNAFRFGAIGLEAYFDIIVSKSRTPGYYAKGKPLRRRDCQIDARNLYDILVSRLDTLTQWTLFRILSDKFENDKKLKLKVALRAK